MRKLPWITGAAAVVAAFLFVPLSPAILDIVVPSIVPAMAQLNQCPNTSPGFTAGGNIFGRTKDQWNQYFAAKVDAVNGVLCNPTIVGGTVGPAVPDGTIMANASGGTAQPQPIAPNTGTILVSGGAITFAATGVTPGTYTNSSVTVDSFGRITSAASGAGGVCGTLASGGVMFGTGLTTCAVNEPKFSWDNTNFRLAITALPGIGPNGGFGIDLIGGNDSRGGAQRIRQSLAGGSLRLGYSDSNSHAYIDARDASDNITTLTLNRGDGTVMIGGDSPTFVNQPAEFSHFGVSLGAVSEWWQTLGVSGDFRGGLYANANSKGELRFFNTGGIETTRISGDSTSTSMVPNRFAAAGLRDTTNPSCTGVLQTDADGDLTCAGGGGAGITGSAVNGEIVKGTGAASVGTTGFTLPGSPPGSTQCLQVSAAGAITATGAECDSAAGSGLFSQVRSATPTAASTGLSTWANQGGASVADTATGVSITAPAGAGDSLRVRYKASPVAPYTITALVSLFASSSNYQGCGLGWYDGTKLQVVMYEFNSGWGWGKVLRWTNVTTAGAQDASGDQGAVSMFAWLKIEDDGTNVHFYFSADGVNYRESYSVAKASGFLSAYSNVAFFANRNNNSGSTAAYCTLMSWTQSFLMLRDRAMPANDNYRVPYLSEVA